MINKIELGEIISDLLETAKHLNIRPSDDCILTQACTFMRGNSMSNSKALSKGQVTTPAPTPEVKLCTANQIAYIQKLADELGVDVNISEKNTSLEASELIKGLKKEMYERSNNR